MVITYNTSNFLPASCGPATLRCLSAPTGYTSYGNGSLSYRIYHHEQADGDWKDFQEAMEFCRQDGARLVELSEWAEAFTVSQELTKLGKSL